MFAILIVKHVNLLLNASGFAFSGVLLCCISSVVMRIDNDTLYYSNNINYDQLLSLTNCLMKEEGAVVTILEKWPILPKIKPLKNLFIFT